MSQDDHIDPTISDVAKFLRLPIRENRPGFDDCGHLKVTLDDEAHTVTCDKCGKQLDPFWYLQLLAKEWQTRAYRDQAAIEAHKALRQKDQEDRAKGHIFARPTSPGPAQEAWDTFVEYYGYAPYSIYYSCKEWRAAGDQTSSESVSFLRKLIADRIRRDQK